MDSKNLILLFNNAQAGVVDELKKIQMGEIALDTKERLTYIYSELGKLKNILQDGKEIEYHPTLSRIVIDQWPRTNKIGQSILEVESIFKKYQAKKFGTKNRKNR